MPPFTQKHALTPCPRPYNVSRPVVFIGPTLFSVLWNLVSLASWLEEAEPQYPSYVLWFWPYQSSFVWLLAGGKWQWSSAS